MQAHAAPMQFPMMSPDQQMLLMQQMLAQAGMPQMTQQQMTQPTQFPVEAQQLLREAQDAGEVPEECQSQQWPSWL